MVNIFMFLVILYFNNLTKYILVLKNFFLNIVILFFNSQVLSK